MQLLNDVFVPLLDIFGCLVVIFLVSIFIGWLLGFSRKNELSKCDDKITAVLYDSKVERVIDMVTIDKSMDVIKAPKTRPVCDGGPYFVSGNNGIYPEENCINYHFFCVQDDGKHIYIERS